MKKRNLEDYGLADTVTIPEPRAMARNYGREALAFIRENCTDLCFDTESPERIALKDADGRSNVPNIIPYNMEKDRA